MMLEFTVHGRPAGMGSKRAFIRGNRAIVTDDNSSHRLMWANAVTAAAAEAMNGRDLIVEALGVQAMFYFVRPRSHFGTGRNAEKLKPSAPQEHAQQPDIDKLARCLLDAMTGVVYVDDRQVMCLTAAKFWADSQAMAQVFVTEATEGE